MQREAPDRMHQHGLAECGTAPGAALAINRSFHVDERQRHKFGEAARFRLQRTDAQEMSRPVLVAIDVPEHDGGRAFEASMVRRAHDVEPLLGADLVGTKNDAYLIVENFRRGAGERSKACGLEPLQKRLDLYAERCSTLMHLQRRERVN